MNTIKGCENIAEAGGLQILRRNIQRNYGRGRF
nr:MAG TPA: hypothetical protein [Caudoviricetes sp.]